MSILLIVPKVVLTQYVATEEVSTVTYDKDRIEIIVNARKRIVSTDELTFDEVVRLAFDPPPSGPYIEITVTFRNGGGRPPEGRLFAGQTVKVHEGTVFNVRATDKS